MDIQLTTLSTDLHNRELFDCDNPQVNHFFRSVAKQSAKNNTVHTFALTDMDSDPSVVMGFYALTACIDPPPEGVNSFLKNKKAIPGVLLAQLGVDKKHQGHQLGAQLLLSAETHYLEKMLPVTTSIGLFVDAMTVDLVPFYEKHGYKLVDPKDPNCTRLWKKNDDCLSILSLLPTQAAAP